MWAPCFLKLRRHYWIQLPIIIINYAAKEISPLIKLSRDPFWLQLDLELYRQRENFESYLLQPWLLTSH
jgi:hypothetical protein